MFCFSCAKKLSFSQKMATNCRICLKGLNHCGAICRKCHECPDCSNTICLTCWTCITCTNSAFCNFCNKCSSCSGKPKSSYRRYECIDYQRWFSNNPNYQVWSDIPTNL